MAVHHAKECAFAPEFDFQQQALLYLPQKIPDVREPGVRRKPPTRSCSPAGTEPGPRAFCMFTSYSQDEYIFRTCAHAVDFPR